jgi:AcrR family transcriptional regulator
MSDEMKPSASPTRVARTKAASLERRESRKRELREQILQAAGEEFVQHGPEGFSLRRVAERIGYSPTTIYLYFQNKEDLLLSTVEDGFKSFDQAIQDAVSGATGAPAKLEALGRAYIAFGLENAALYRLMFMQPATDFSMPRLLGSGTSPSDLEAAAQSGHHRVVAQELLVAAVREGIDSGLFREGDPVLLADALWAGVHGLVALALSPLMAPEHAEKVISPLLATLVNGLKS